ncbi:MAG: DUF4910 domain-containing protein [Dehalococcoidia bacterium]|nr:DUF4910 domain-containing protein [Dehalococcoidia bacterium]
MGAVGQLIANLDVEDTGRALHQQIRDLYPLCRSITGEGLRETLRWIQRSIPLEVREVATGTQVLDWTVPREWSIRDAYIADAAGNRVVDFKRHNLHVVNYSAPISARMSLDELRPHLYTLPDRPGWIPYRTSYYDESWGFCLSHNQLLALPDGEYDVCIDSTLADGHLSYGEYVIAGESAEEILVSTHVCHPSLANDNLSGTVVATRLAELLSRDRHRYTFRFLFIPGTIGSITWLALNKPLLGNIRHGLVLAGAGDAGPLSYKRSRRGNAGIDRAVEHVLRQRGNEYLIRDFEPYGYDERQYCSPGFNLPVGNVSRTPFGQYPEYHTSADDPDFVKADALADSLAFCLEILHVLESNGRHFNLMPEGEPQLGRRGLYGPIGGATEARTFQMAMLWALNLSDGSHSLLDIAERAGMPFGVIYDAAEALTEHGLLKPLPPDQDA